MRSRTIASAGTPRNPQPPDPNPGLFPDVAQPLRTLAVGRHDVPRAGSPVDHLKHHVARLPGASANVFQQHQWTEQPAETVLEHRDRRSRQRPRDSPAHATSSHPVDDPRGVTGPAPSCARPARPMVPTSLLGRAHPSGPDRRCVHRKLDPHRLGTPRLPARRGSTGHGTTSPPQPAGRTDRSDPGDVHGLSDAGTRRGGSTQIRALGRVANLSSPVRSRARLGADPLHMPADAEQTTAAPGVPADSRQAPAQRLSSRTEETRRGPPLRRCAGVRQPEGHATGSPSSV